MQKQPNSRLIILVGKTFDISASDGKLPVALFLKYMIKVTNEKMRSTKSSSTDNNQMSQTNRSLHAVSREFED
jgi:hypothetical protein